jgi:hypothetical protein
MNLRASWRAFGLLTGWALPVLAGVLLAPAGARADCGDYATTRLSHAGMPPLAEPKQPAAPQPHKPCSGPHCSQAPVAPLAPAPTAPSQSAEEWGCTFDGLALVPLEPSRPVDAQTVRLPIRLASEIFHPPRLSS